MVVASITVAIAEGDQGEGAKLQIRRLYGVADADGKFVALWQAHVD